MAKGAMPRRCQILFFSNCDMTLKSVCTYNYTKLLSPFNFLALFCDNCTQLLRISNVAYKSPVTLAYINNKYEFTVRFA